MSSDPSTPKLSYSYGTSILDLEWTTPTENNPYDERFPSAETNIEFYLAPPKDRPNEPHAKIEAYMGGDIRRLMYWPDNGEFKVYEDNMDVFEVRHQGQLVNAYGTRQTGVRVGEFDPSKGGCG